MTSKITHLLAATALSAFVAVSEAKANEDPLDCEMPTKTTKKIAPPVSSLMLAFPQGCNVSNFGNEYGFRPKISAECIVVGPGVKIGTPKAEKPSVKRRTCDLTS